MNYRSCYILILALFVISGCAKTEVTDQKTNVSGQRPHPAQIWVYDFVATPDDLPIHTNLDDQYFKNNPPQSKEHIAEGNKLGMEIQSELVKALEKIGISAKHANTGTTPQLNDLVIQGYILSFEEGDEKKRVAIGLGQGASHIKAAVEILQMTDSGLLALGSYSTDAGGNKTPGGAVGLAALAVTKSPAGLIVSTGSHAYGEYTGSSKVEGRAQQTAEEIAEQIETRFKEQGWL